MKLNVLDWAVILFYVVGMLLIGWHFGRRTRTREEYLLGGRNMRPLAVGISLFASLISTISYLAWPGEVIKNGPMMLSVLLAYPLVGLVVGWWIIPRIMRLPVTSAYEILEVRLGLAVRLLGSALFLLLRMLWMAVIVYATTTKVLVPVLGLPVGSAPALCLLLGLVTVAYTSMGGLRAVVLTDVIQSAILCGSAVITLVVITVSLGGPSAWWPSHWLEHWPEPVFGYDPHARVTMFGAVLAQFTWYLCTSGSDQIAVQRYLATRDARSARSVLLISLAADGLVTLLLAAVGLGLLAAAQAQSGLLSVGHDVLADADKLFVRFLVSRMPPGVSGLVVAGLLAAAMSALSAGISSTGSVLTVDFLERLGRGGKRGPGAARLLSLGVGAAVVALSLAVGMVQGNLLEICYKVVNLLTAPLFGLFFLAMFVPWAKAHGAIAGAVVGIAVAVGISYSPELTGTQGVSFLWAMPLSLVAEVATGALVSLVPWPGRPTALPDDEPLPRIDT